MAESLDPEAFSDFLDRKPGWIVLTTIAPDGYPPRVPLGSYAGLSAYHPALGPCEVSAAERVLPRTYEVLTS